MDNSQEFLVQLEMGLTQRYGYLEKEYLPKLKDHLRSFHTVFMGLNNFLIERGFLQKNPYNYDQKMADFTLPSSDPISEQDLVSEVSFRLSSYGEVADFINNFFHMTTESLTLRNIKKILAFLDYINWKDLSSSSNHMMTKSVALITDKFKNIQDNLQRQIAEGMLQQMRQHTVDIKKQLKAFTLFQREAYKFKIRQVVIANMDIDPSQAKHSPEDVAMNIKYEIPSHIDGKTPFYKELILEILAEDYSNNSEQMRQNIFKTIETVKKRPVHKVSGQQKKTKDTLLKILLELGHMHTQLGACRDKIIHNTNKIAEQKRTVGERFSRWLSHLFGGKNNDTLFEVDITNSSAGLKKKEIIDGREYSQKLANKVRQLSSMSSQGGSTYVKATSLPEAKVYDFVEDVLRSIQSIHKRLEGLNEYFSTIQDKTIRAKMKGFKNENNIIRSSIGDVRKKLTEYTAQRDEVAQLQSLGIDVSVD